MRTEIETEASTGMMSTRSPARSSAQPLHHTITNSRNNPVSFSFISDLPDLATKVGPCFFEGDAI